MPKIIQPCKILSQADAAYLAGIVDAEGCVTVSIHAEYIYSCIEIGSTCKALIDHIQTLTGHHRFYKKPHRLSKHKQLYLWQFKGPQVCSFLEQIRPYLVIKAAQADLVLDLLGKRLSSLENEAKVGLVRQLNFRGDSLGHDNSRIEINLTGRKYRKQANNLSVINAAYVAGIIDGDGMISAAYRRGYVEAFVCVGVTQKELVFYLKKVTGIGHVCSCNKRASNHKRIHEWNVPVASVKSLLVQLFEYMTVKRSQAEAVIKLVSFGKKPSYFVSHEQTRLVNSIRKLNQRGVLHQDSIKQN